jgi:hypothetical protein
MPAADKVNSTFIIKKRTVEHVFPLFLGLNPKTSSCVLSLSSRKPEHMSTSSLHYLQTRKKITWAQYETEVFNAFKFAYPRATILKNQKIRGKLSGRSRQIDILINETFGGETIITIVDCKLYSSIANIKHVETFIGMMADIGADKGLMISELGYSSSALERAYNNPEHLELDIFSLKDLKSNFHGYGAIPHAGRNAALVLAPFGWIIDAHAPRGLLCYMYQKGLTLEEAGALHQFAYVNFWDKSDQINTIDALLKFQEDRTFSGKRINKLIYKRPVLRDDAATAIRIADIQTYPAIEVTGFIDFENFIFFCVCFTPKVYLKSNLRRIENLLRTTLPMDVRQ